MLSMSQLTGFNVGGEHDPYWDNTNLLFHFDGNFVDSKNGATLTASYPSDPATISGTSRFGSGSARMDGTYGSMEYYNDNLNPSNVAFTLEGFIYINGLNLTSANVFGLIGSGSIALQASYGGGTYYLMMRDFPGTSCDVTALVNSWIHVAIVRNGSNLSLYINGVSGATFNVGTQSFSAANFVLGYYNSAQCFNGYIDEVRYTKGIARYTANFIPPTAPFPNS